VLVAVGGESSVLAAKTATSVIPIVFSIGGDPVQLGLVASFSRPGGNITGFSLLTVEVDTKRLGVLHELVPAARVIAVLLNPTLQQAAAQRKELEHAAHIIDRQIYILNATNDAELTAAFKAIVERHAEALFIGGSPFFDTRRDRIIALAAEHRVPAIHLFPEHAAAGGLISYGPSISDGYHQVGVYAGRILKGEKAGELPVVQSAKFELVINLKTAKALGLTVPSTLLARADEVIE
jgi:putative ABC transport system substrate-binding protein